MNTRLLSENEVAQRLNVKPKLLRDWRHQKRGPDFLRLGRTVRYALEDIEEYISASAVRMGGRR